MVGPLAASLPRPARSWLIYAGTSKQLRDRAETEYGQGHHLSRIDAIENQLGLGKSLQTRNFNARMHDDLVAVTKLVRKPSAVGSTTFSS